MQNTNKHSQSGIALIVTIVLISIMLSSVVLVSKEMVDEVKNSTRMDNSLIAYYAAEAGFEDAMLQFRYDKDIDIGPNQCTNIDTGAVITPSTDCGKIFTQRYSSVSMTNEVPSITTKILRDNTYEFYVDTTHMSNYVNLWWKENPSTPNASPTKNGYRVEITGYDQSGNVLGSPIKNFTCPQDIRTDLKLRKSDFDIASPSGKRIIRVKPWYTQWLPNCPTVSPDGGNGLDSNGNIIGASTGNEIPYIELTVTKGNPNDSLGSPITVIESVGYYGGVQRKIVANIDHSSGNVLSVFDYAIYSGGDLIKQLK